MKRILAAIALLCAAVLPAACNPNGDAPAAAETPAPVESAKAPEVAAPAPSAPVAAGEPAAPGAPAFAALYPGAVLDAPAVIASSASGPGGLATYTTSADPDAVIAFYRANAEAAGLSSANVMEQGAARAYGATSADGDENLQVVASATEAGSTSVQISWSAGS